MQDKPPQSVEQLLQAMVRFDTVTAFISKRPDPEAPLALWLEELAQSWGLATRRLPIAGESFNLLVTAEPAPGRPWLVLESHLDTVSVDGMTIDPFGGEIKGGKLLGRGACDTKGTGASMLWALRQYARQSPRPNNAAVLFVCGEEYQKTGAVAFAEKQLATLGFRPSAMVVGEPTMLRPVAAHNGVVRWTVRTHGIACHSSDPANGKSAISMMTRVIDAIERRYLPTLTMSHPLTGKAQCSINLIRGGSQINIIPDSCEIEIDRRIVPGEDARDVLPAVERVLEQVRRENPGFLVTQGEPFIDPALNPRGADRFIAFARRVLEKMNLDGEPAGVAYGTDASTYCDVGIPSIVLGPGDIKQAHTKDEWLALEQLSRAVDVYLSLLSTPMEDSHA